MTLPRATESTSVSFPSWLLTVAEAAGLGFNKSRSKLVVSGLQTQVITELRYGRIVELLSRIHGINVDPSETETVSFEINRELLKIFENHAYECGYMLNNMILIALSKYMLQKDSPLKLWETLYHEATNNNDFFHTVIG